MGFAVGGCDVIKDLREDRGALIVAVVVLDYNADFEALVEGAVLEHQIVCKA